MTSLSGWLLVGRGSEQRIVLIAHHNETGAFGICLNDASDTSWEQVFGDDIAAAVKQNPIFIGGPDKEDKPWVLHPVVPDIAFENSLELGAAQLTLSLDGLSVAASGDFGALARIGFGVYTWQPGELEASVSDNKDWQIIPASDAILFSIGQDRLYETCVQVADALAKKMADQS
ncbi:YqgE/AlgH family protein [Salinibius halmophilus]|uniref:YqgE/AlgH family protein n=1 Tax=Salinibius halmophilus TaxID=1853216 RepID=UPI000E66069F|nr:YqgE/AlgH family protein [Salinibius halmophilus]